MKKIQLILLSIIFLVYNCKQEIKFDQNSEIDHILKTNIQAYCSTEIKDEPTDFVLILKRKIKYDTLEYVLSATSSIGVFADDSVSFHTFYMNQNVFTNFKNSHFIDSCNLRDASQYLSKDEARMYMITNKIPGPAELWTIRKLRLVFYQNKLVEKRYFYLH